MASRWGLEALCHLFAHDPFKLQVERSEAYYQYQIVNTVHLSLYSEAQREDLHARLLDGDAAEGSDSPPVLPVYLLILLGHYLLLVLAAWFALWRKDAAVRSGTVQS